MLKQTFAKFQLSHRLVNGLLPAQNISNNLKLSTKITKQIARNNTWKLIIFISKTPSEIRRKMLELDTFF